MFASSGELSRSVAFAVHEKSGRCTVAIVIEWQTSCTPVRVREQLDRVGHSHGHLWQPCTGQGDTLHASRTGGTK